MHLSAQDSISLLPTQLNNALLVIQEVCRNPGLRLPAPYKPEAQRPSYTLLNLLPAGPLWVFAGKESRLFNGTLTHASCVAFLDPSTAPGKRTLSSCFISPLTALNGVNTWGWGCREICYTLFGAGRHASPSPR